MSLLQQQLKELQTKQEKVAYLREAVGALELLGKPEDSNEPAVTARAEVIAELTEYINGRIDSIENGKEIEPVKQAGTVAGQFTAEEVTVLKTFVARAQNRTPAPAPVSNANNGAFASENEAPAAPKKPETPGQKAKRQDMLQFALANRHLDRKRVIVRTEDGQVGGIVVGLMAPNVIVKTDTGHEVPVDLDNLIVES